MRYLGQIVCAASKGGNNLNGVRASLDLDAVGTCDIDTVIESNLNDDEGNGILISAVDDAPGALTIDVDPVAKTVVIHFKNNNSTISDFEAAVAALAGDDAIIRVKQAGTGGQKWLTATDVFSEAPLAGGVGFTVPTNCSQVYLQSTVAGVQWEMVASGGTTSATNGAFMVAANTLYGPFDTGDLGPSIAVWNPTGSPTTVRVFAGYV